ncbi:MAG: hypothetical protein GX247_05695 [Mollicutes bacterium]|nr:hypothetical protein [Mollicutes bacterium]
MEKKLPKMFVNKIDKELNNNKKVYYSKSNNIEKEEKKEINENWLDLSNKTVKEKLDAIFNSPSYVYQASVDITLKSGTISKKVIGKSLTHIITMDDELIPIDEIIDIDYTK